MISTPNITNFSENVSFIILFIYHFIYSPCYLYLSLFYSEKSSLSVEHTGKGTVECWPQKKGSCTFIEMVLDNCIYLKVKGHSLAASPKRFLLCSDGISVNNRLLLYT